MPFSLPLFSEFLRGVTAPVLFIGGGEDGFHPPDEAERLAVLAHATRLDLPGAGHMLHWTAPEAVSAAILEHVRNALATPAPGR